MRESLFKAYLNAKDNSENSIVFRRNGKRETRTFSELYEDIWAAGQALKVLAGEGNSSVGIVGKTSYEWMVCDLACLFFGLRSITYPEGVPIPELLGLIRSDPPTLLLVDREFLDPLSEFKVFDLQQVYSRWSEVSIEKEWSLSLEDVLWSYSTAFTSGTTGGPKPLEVTFFKPSPPKGFRWVRRLRRLHFLIRNRNSFWRRSDNKVIIFMPFSHRQQREFVQIALLRRINIVLSTPENCLLDIIREKPNIMVSVPSIYETMAELINREISSEEFRKNFWWRLYRTLRLSRLPGRSRIRIFVEKRGMESVRKIFGSRGDYFVSGSAPLSREVMQSLSEVGLRVHQAYGTSEIGVIAMTSERHWKAGTVGRPLVEMKIAEDGEVLVKFDDLNHKTAEVRVNSDGYIHTGDVGRMDKQGYLSILGRVDNLLVLPNGKKVMPELLEAKWNALLAPAQCVMIQVDDSLRLLVFQSRKSPLRQVHRSQFADWEWPEFYRTSEFPLDGECFTANGKPRRRRILESLGDPAGPWSPASELFDGSHD